MISSDGMVNNTKETTRRRGLHPETLQSMICGGVLKWRHTLVDLLHYNVLDDFRILRLYSCYMERTKRLAMSKLFPEVIKLV